MKRCLVIGKANVGKTLFVLNFALYLGVQAITVTAQEADGRRTTASVSLNEAVKLWVSTSPHHTRALQTLELSLPVGKGTKRFELIDSTGLTDGIATEHQLRQAMAQTLSAVRDTHLTLHMIDCAQVAAVGSVQAIGEVDFQVAHFAHLRGGYFVLANKMDLPAAHTGLELVRREFGRHPIIPISALTGTGFPEVKRLVARAL